MPPLLSSLFNAYHFPQILPNLRPSPFRTALGSLVPSPFDLRSTSVLLLKWENDGRTMGELRTKERWKSGRTHIGHRDGNQNKNGYYQPTHFTYLYSLSCCSHGTAPKACTVLCMSRPSRDSYRLSYLLSCPVPIGMEPCITRYKRT